MLGLWVFCNQCNWLCYLLATGGSQKSVDDVMTTESVRYWFVLTWWLTVRRLFWPPLLSHLRMLCIVRVTDGLYSPECWHLGDDPDHCPLLSHLRGTEGCWGTDWLYWPEGTDRLYSPEGTDEYNPSAPLIYSAPQYPEVWEHLTVGLLIACCLCFRWPVPIIGPLTICLCFRWPVPVVGPLIACWSMFQMARSDYWPTHYLLVYVSDGPFPWWVLVIVVVISLSVSTYIIFKCFLRYCGWVSKT